VNVANSAQSEGPSPFPRAATLKLRSVSKRYHGQREPAIEELTLSVEAGEACVLVAPSGSGKTTAMRLINGMIPQLVRWAPGGPSSRPRPQPGCSATVPSAGLQRYRALAGHQNPDVLFVPMPDSLPPIGAKSISQVLNSPPVLRAVTIGM